MSYSVLRPLDYPSIWLDSWTVSSWKQAFPPRRHSTC